jgi:hypothetical protein
MVNEATSLMMHGLTSDMSVKMADDSLLMLGVSLNEPNTSSMYPTPGNKILPLIKCSRNITCTSSAK